MKIAKIGVLLLNLGTPSSPTLWGVAKFLREFLLDSRVITLPSFLRMLLVYGVIIPFRVRQSTEAYKSIWTEAGSPLAVHSASLRAALANKLSSAYQIELGMRYGQPSIEDALKRLEEEGCQQLIIIPLFPQYSSAATGSALQRTLALISSQTIIPEIQIISDYFEDAGYIRALAENCYESLEGFVPDIYLFSYHGLPEQQISQIERKDASHCDREGECPAISETNRFCYRAQCFQTSRLLADAMGLAPDQYIVSFQSRLGRLAWIKPYTDHVLPVLAKQGVKNLAVICPAFVSDCLETLEEIGLRAREQWLSLGGEGFKLIPCLNDHPLWIKALADRISPQ